MTLDEKGSRGMHSPGTFHGCLRENPFGKAVSQLLQGNCLYTSLYTTTQSKTPAGDKVYPPKVALIYFLMPVVPAPAGAMIVAQDWVVPAAGAAVQLSKKGLYEPAALPALL